MENKKVTPLKRIGRERGFRGPLALSKATGVPFRTCEKHWRGQLGVGAKWIFVYATALDCNPQELREGMAGMRVQS